MALASVVGHESMEVYVPPPRLIFTAAISRLAERASTLSSAPMMSEVQARMQPLQIRGSSIQENTWMAMMSASGATPA